MSCRREIPGFLSYEASADGLIFRKGADASRKPSSDRKGYLVLKLRDDGRAKRTIRVHRLVCLAFHGLPPAERPHAAHINSDKSNNCSDNVAWKSPKENESDKFLVGTSNQGQRNGRAKLTPQQVEEIRASSEPSTVLAPRYGLEYAHFTKVRRGLFWKEQP